MLSGDIVEVKTTITNTGNNTIQKLMYIEKEIPVPFKLIPESLSVNTSLGFDITPRGYAFMPKAFDLSP